MNIYVQNIAGNDGDIIIDDEEDDEDNKEEYEYEDDNKQFEKTNKNKKKTLKKHHIKKKISSNIKKIDIRNTKNRINRRIMKEILSELIIMLTDYSKKYPHYPELFQVKKLIKNINCNVIPCNDEIMIFIDKLKIYLDNYNV